MRLWDKDVLSRNPESFVLGVDVTDDELSEFAAAGDGLGALLRDSGKFLEWRDEVVGRLTSGERFCVVEGLRFEDFESDEALMNLYILALSEMLGVPTQTDKREGRIVWPIKCDAVVDGENLTYSQHMSEADLHTDTQYFSNPEQVIGLWCLKADKDGGGENLLVDGRNVVSSVREELDGEALIDVLSEGNFPFRVPSAFTETGKDDCVEVFTGPIVGDNPLLRYRKQTIHRASLIAGYELGDKEREAVERFDRVLNSEHLIYRFLLQRGQVLLVNNHEVLHGRTAFSDTERCLMRVRLNLHS